MSVGTPVPGLSQRIRHLALLYFIPSRNNTVLHPIRWWNKGLGELHKCLLRTKYSSLHSNGKCISLVSGRNHLQPMCEKWPRVIGWDRYLKISVPATGSVVGDSTPRSAAHLLNTSILANAPVSPDCPDSKFSLYILPSFRHPHLPAPSIPPSPHIFCPTKRHTVSSGS